MGRAIVAVIVAFVLWTILWLGFNAAAQAAFPEILDPTQPLTHVGALIAFIVYAAVISVVAGYVCAAVRRDPAMKTVWVFAAIQLLVGIGVEVGYWDMMPVWYHITFLALLVPATVAGGRLETR